MKQIDEVDEVINQIKINKGTDGSGHFMAKENQEILGEFDGQNMQGEDGKNYPIPHNYASKSQLVEGDRMKLIITPDGEFIYKQIGLADRKRFIGQVQIDNDGDYCVLCPLSRKRYKILLASANYYKLKPMDEVVLIIPRGRDSQWGAVENVICKK